MFEYGNLIKGGAGESGVSSHPAPPLCLKDGGHPASETFVQSEQNNLNRLVNVVIFINAR